MNEPIVDIHCHTFNADDLPVRGFIQRVALHDGALGSTLAQLVDVLIQHGAPGFEEEKPRLDALLSHDELESTFEVALPAFPVDPQGQFDQEVDEAMADLQARNPGLVRRVGHDLEAAQRTAVVSSDDGVEAFPDVFGTARRAVRWVKLFGKSRLDVTGIMVSTYGDVDLFCPMLVDMGASLGDLAPTTTHQQVVLQEKISRLSMLESLPGGGKARIHPFVGFDPRHEVKARAAKDIQTPLDIVKEAIDRYGFVGVKVYPPMGWRPIKNVSVGDMTASEAAAIDDALRDLYGWCQEQQVPITAHCNDSNYAHGSYQTAGLASPDGWLDVLAEFPELHLNLGHFGGARQKEDSNGWPWRISRAAAQFDYLFADVGNHDVYDTELSAAYLERLHQIFGDARSTEMERRLMYGSDWFMVAIHPAHEQFLDTYRGLYERRFGGEATSAFIGGTALRFLGFDDQGNKNNKRLRSRYETFAPNQIPEWLA